MTTKAKAAIIGPGNIGTDLLMKCQRSDFIEATWMVGIEDSAGIQRRADAGVFRPQQTASMVWLPGFLENPVDFVFDCNVSLRTRWKTVAKVTALGATMIDLTPAAIGALLYTAG